MVCSHMCAHVHVSEHLQVTCHFFGDKVSFTESGVASFQLDWLAVKPQAHQSAPQPDL